MRARMVSYINNTTIVHVCVIYTHEIVKNKMQFLHLPKIISSVINL